MDFENFRLRIPLAFFYIIIPLLVGLYSSAPRISSLDDIKYLVGIETCSHHDVHDAVKATENLRLLLKDRLFGQHLVQDGLLKETYLHLDKKNPSEPLIISLHGPPGSGKSFTAELVAQAIYRYGGQSNYVKFFTASHHFPDPGQLPEYKKYIKQVVTETVQKCPRALFVFDEVDKLPAGLLDTLLPFITHPGTTLDGIEYKKAIYLFLGNSGAEQINNLTYTHYKNGKKRRDLKLSEFQTVLSETALKKQGGWYKSEMIENIRVRWFIPYLPMERRHVLECFRRLAKDHPEAVLSEDDFEEMAKQLVFWPEKEEIYSSTGCKRVENILLYEIAVQKYPGAKRKEF